MKTFLTYPNTNLSLTAPKKDWSLGDWLANFYQDDGSGAYYDGFYDDVYEEETMPGGDALEIDDGLLESVVILGLAAALVFLVMYRQQRQQAARRQEEERRQQQQLQGIVAAQGVAAAAVAGAMQRDGGFFPPPPQEGGQGFAWGVGGVGH